MVDASQQKTIVFNVGKIMNNESINPDNKQVHVVFYQNYDECNFIGAVTTQENLDFIKSHHPGCEFETFQLDDLPNLPKDKFLYMVNVCYTGEILHCSQASALLQGCEKNLAYRITCAPRDFKPGYAVPLHMKFAITYVWAKDVEHAKRIASLRKQLLIDQNLWEFNASNIPLPDGYVDPE